MPELALTAGFWGKVPSRGDFVGAGLPGDFITAWDGWISAGLAHTQAVLGAARFLAAWLEAPVWRFAAAPGLFGAGAWTGLWMPSVDRAGRHFPLVFAAAGGADAAWLDAAEAAGRAALAEQLEPTALAARLPPAPPAPAEAAGGRWWTEGAPLVPATCFGSPTLPAAETFVLMLDASGGQGLCPWTPLGTEAGPQTPAFIDGR